MLITKELLKGCQACKSGIKFFENNFTELNTTKIKVTGDYNDFYIWLQRLPKIKVDDKGNIIQKKYPDGSISEWKYKYNINNNLIWEKFPNNNIFEYKYDKNHNLIWKKLPNGNIYEWKYDENNNLILKKYLDDHIHEYQYDHYNNMIWRKYPNGEIYETKYDSNNNKIWEKDSDGDIEEWKYDNNSNLIWEKDSNGSIKEWKFKRDPKDRLIEITENNKILLTVEYLD